MAPQNPANGVSARDENQRLRAAGKLYRAQKGQATAPTVPAAPQQVNSYQYNPDSGKYDLVRGQEFQGADGQMYSSAERARTEGAVGQSANLNLAGENQLNGQAAQVQSAPSTAAPAAQEQQKQLTIEQQQQARQESGDLYQRELASRGLQSGDLTTQQAGQIYRDAKSGAGLDGQVSPSQSQPAADIPKSDAPPKMAPPQPQGAKPVDPSIQTRVAQDKQAMAEQQKAASLQKEQETQRSASAVSGVMNDETPLSDMLTNDPILAESLRINQENLNLVIDTLKRNQEIMDASFQAEMARLQKSAAAQQDMLEVEKEIQQKRNDLAAEKSENSYKTQLELANDNFSRLTGYLKAKLAASGAIDSSAGMLLLSKGVQAGQLALNGLIADSENARLSFVQQGEDIAMNFAKASLQVQSDLNSQLSDISFKRADAITQINESLTDSQVRKNDNTLKAISESYSRQQEAKQKAFERQMALRNQALSEAQFAYQKEWNLTTFQANREDEWFNRDIRMSDLTGEVYSGGEGTGQATQARQQWQAGYNLSIAQFEQDKKEFGLSYALQQQGADREQWLMDYNVAKDMYESGIDKTALEMYKSPASIMNSGLYFGKGEQKLGLGTLITNTIKKVANGDMDGWYQCVQFCRDVIPDLPYGLFTLQDKLDKLLGTKNAVPAPSVGAVVVMNPSLKDPNQTPGHVAIVSNVAEDGSWFDISEFNYKAGQYTSRRIKTDDKTIEGYWMSPSVQQGGNDTAAQYRSLKDSVKNDVQVYVNRFETLPVVKDFVTVQNKLQSMESILKSGEGGPGDVSAVYEFMKALDPTSVVRESEYATAAASGNIFTGTFAKLNSLFNPKGGKLSEQVRQSFLSIIRQKYEVASQQYNNVYREYQRKIDSLSGIDGTGELFLTDYGSSFTENPQRQPASSGSNSAAASYLNNNLP